VFPTCIPLLCTRPMCIGCSSAIAVPLAQPLRVCFPAISNCCAPGHNSQDMLLIS
jgi:hypothetical protein